MANYYQLLGISKDADEKQIQQAFRRLARKYHPDLNPGDEEAEQKFKEINEAHEVLSDPDNRRKYDRYGDKWKSADAYEGRGGSGTYAWGNGPSGGATNVDFGSFGDLRDIFGSSLGGYGRRAPTAAASHVDVAVSVSLEEAFTGATRLVRVPTIGEERRIEVTIPAGVDTGSTVHIGVDKETQLFLKMTVTPHPRITRKGNDLYTEADVPFEDAVLGGEIEVQTMRGKVRLTIPPESKSGQNIRLSGQGMPKLNSPDEHGDLYVAVRPVLPADLTDEERELIDKFRTLRSGNNKG